MGDLKERIKRLLVDTLFLQGVDPMGIKDNANLQEMFQVDSVALFQIVAGLEEVFGVRIEDEDFDADCFSTVEGIAGVVESKLGGGSA